MAGGFPEDLRDIPRTPESYARGRRLVAQEYAKDGEFEPAIENLFALQKPTTCKCTTPQPAASSRSSEFRNPGKLV